MRRGRSHIRGSCDICIARSVPGYARHLLCRRGCIYAQRGILYCVFRAGLPSVFTLRAGCFAASVFGPAEAVAADRRRDILFLCRVPLPVVSVMSFAVMQLPPYFAARASAHVASAKIIIQFRGSIVKYFCTRHKTPRMRLPVSMAAYLVPFPAAPIGFRCRTFSDSQYQIKFSSS